MQTQSLTFAVSAGVPDAAQQWLAPILAAWPGKNGPPRVVEATLESLAHCRDSVPGLGRGDDDGPVLVVFGDEPIYYSSVLADRLRMTLRPAMFLFRDPEPAHRAIPGDAAIIESLDTSPKILAAMLYALGQRQPAVQALADELFVMQASQGGIDTQVRRLHDELQLASAVQREFLPTDLPRVQGLDMGAVFRPAGFVSGDIFGVHALGPSTASFFLADAVGHGVPAALLTVALSRTLQGRERCGSPTPLLDPCAALARVNDDLVRHPGGPHRFATAVCGIVDAATGRVTLAGAGHPPPICLSAEGWRAIETQGPMLGVFEDAEFPHVTFDLQPGETLLVYSDGLDAALDDIAIQPGSGGTVGLIADILRRGIDPQLSIADAVRRLGLMIDDQSGSLHQRDDVTVLAIRADSAAAAGRVDVRTLSAA